jgi:DNA mismatch repair protein MutH
MPLNLTRTYWKMRVDAAKLEQVRQKAAALAGATLNEDADCVRVIGPKDAINELERACGIDDEAYWGASAKPMDGSVLDLKKPETPAPAKAE